MERVLEVGVGAGFDALRFCELGVDYLGVDSSPTAVEIASERVGHLENSGLIVCLDIFDLTLDHRPDLVFDRGVFHNQAAESDQRKLVTKCADLLARGGHWVSVIGCADSREEIPHGALRLSDVTFVVEPYFEILSVNRRPYGPDDWPHNFDAWYCLFRKRA